MLALTAVGLLVMLTDPFFDSSWISNTDLLELNVDAIGEQAKKSKKQALKAAYEIAAEKHDLAWFKNVLKERTEAAEAETEEAVEAEPKKSKGKRKSKAAEEEAEDIDMEAVDEMELDDDVEPEKKSKPRKRKKDVDSEGEGSKVSRSCCSDLTRRLAPVSLRGTLR